MPLITAVYKAGSYNGLQKIWKEAVAASSGSYVERLTKQKKGRFSADYGLAPRNKVRYLQGHKVGLTVPASAD
jgi:hypothetical protein